MSVRRLDHVSVSVADLARSQHFYHGLLALPVLGTGEEESTALARALKVPRVRFRFADLDIGERGILELLEYLEPRPGRPDRRPFDRGLAHFGLTVDDLNSTIARLKGAGVEIWFGPELLEGPAWWAGARTAYATDPDGVTLEIIERPNVEP
jgi:catechol 2,3-dioxygenase-like lactoylglutathione lyase family enzyme